jgi:hypothetical protein
MATDPSSHPEVPTPPVRGGWVGSIALGMIILAAYLANGREIGSDDTEANVVVAYNLARGDGFYLERLYDRWGMRPGLALPGYLVRSRGHFVSRYPVGPALLALPAMAVQVAFLDRASPGWDDDPREAWHGIHAMAKRAAAFIAALTAVVLHRLFRALGLGRAATAATLAAALGSDLWMVASQSLWQHGPGALAISSAAWLLLPREASRPRIFLAGVAAAALVAFRPVDIVFASAILGRVAWGQPRRLGWFLPAPTLGAVALVGSNLWLFGDVAGGLASLEALHPKVHGLPAGPWSGDLLAGLAGTLFSPSRGLFVFSPWAGLALAMLPFSAGRLARHSVVTWLLWSLVPYGLLLSKYTVWWGGHCFGPRYWTDAVPLLAIALAAGLDWSHERSRPALIAFRASILVALAIQAIGAWCYPSSWNFLPANVDQHHERLWDWRDGELSRCLIEKFGGRRR